MTWNANFPLGTTQINQSVTQIQNNWAFLNTGINYDHYFNSGTANEGHHRFAQMIVQVADVAPGGVGANLALYCKNNNAANPKLYDNTTPSGVRQINSFRSAVSVNVPAGVGTKAIFDFTGMENAQNGLFFASGNSAPANHFGMCYYNYDGTTVTIGNISSGGGITGFTVTAPKIISVNTIGGVGGWPGGTLMVQNMPMEF